MRGRKRIISFLYGKLCVVGLFLLIGSSQFFMFAQNSQQEIPEKTETISPQKPEVEIIPAPDIVIQAQKVSSDLHRYQGMLHPSPVVGKVADEFRSVMSAIKQELAEYEDLEVEHLSFQQLSQVGDRWKTFRFKTEAWQRLLVLRSQELEAIRAELTAERDLWERTREVALTEEYSEALQERIIQVLKEVAGVEQKLRDRLEAVYSLQDQVSTQLSEIAQILNTLELAGQSSRKKLLTQDSPPLWKTKFESREGVPFFRQISDTWDLRVKTIGEFLQNNWVRLLVHIGVFFLLGFLFSGLRRHVYEWIDIGDSVKSSLHILSRPFSVALVMVMIARIWIYPESPQVAAEISRLVMVVPLLRLLPGLVPVEFRLPIYGLGGLYILQMIGEVLPDGSPPQRVVVMVLTFVAFLGMLWVIRPKGVLQSLPSDRWFKFVKYYLKISVLLLAVSIISNLVGNVSLAYLLSGGTFLSIYGFVLLLMAVMVLDGLVFLFLKSRAAQSLRMVRMHTEMWNRGSRRLTRFVALLLWVYLSLDALSLLAPVSNSITEVLRKDLSLGTLTVSLEDILAFVITLIVSVYLARMIRFVLGEDILPRLSLPRGVPNAISFVAYYFVLIAGFIIALGAAGIEWSRFAILAGALGVGIGFGLQNLVNNFVSGLILIFERPIKVGDLIEFASQRGEVLRIGIRSSTVRTWEGSEIIVPNGNLISSEVINWTLSDRKRRLKIPIGVAYGTDPDHVIEILQKVASEHPEVLEEPAPLATFQGFGESSLDFELRFSIKEFLEWIRIQSELYLNIHKDLMAAGIEIPFPQRDLHLRSVDSDVHDLFKKDEKNG